MKKRRSSKSKTKQSDNFNTESGVLKFVDNASDDKKSSNPTNKQQSADIIDIRKYAQEKSNGATGGALKQLDPIIRKISSESKKTASDTAATKKILNNSMANMIATLKFLETPACRRVLPKDAIENQRRDATLKFKNLIVAMDSITVKTNQ